MPNLATGREPITRTETPVVATTRTPMVGTLIHLGVHEASQPELAQNAETVPIASVRAGAEHVLIMVECAGGCDRELLRRFKRRKDGSVEKWE